MENFITLLIPALVSSGVMALVIGMLFKKKTETIAAEVRAQFDQNMTAFKSGYQWKEQCVSELLGQITIQFNRTKRAFSRYNHTNLYLEAKVLKDGNERIRNLLLEKAHLIPSELMEDADKLIEHYDVWLEEFDLVRAAAAPNLNERFVFAGPKGYGFPRDAEARFRAKYQELWQELYG